MGNIQPVGYSFPKWELCAGLLVSMIRISPKSGVAAVALIGYRPQRIAIFIAFPKQLDPCRSLLTESQSAGMGQ
jgi:hypothetical protein